MTYKALLLDVDGTVVPVGPNTRPSPAVEAALKRAMEHVPVCLVSGRSLEWLEKLFDILDLSDPCIINGGSQIIHPRTREILWERPIPQKSFEAVLDIIKAGNIPFIISDNGTEYKNPPFSMQFPKPLAVKLTYFESKEASDRCLADLLHLPDISAHKVTSWDTNRTYRLEIYVTHAAATKEQAAKELAQLIDVPCSAMIAAGDARNDIPLLNACGMKIAMGNADDKLKSVADYVAPSVDEDGVAHIVKRFLFV